jgi:glycosyltransferase involved in cell wall biosynthesis
MKKVLYLTYDGILEPLGYSQVFKYIEKLSKNFKMTLISFEKSKDLHNSKKIAKLSKVAETNNISWIRFKYHKSPEIPATFFDIMMCFLGILFLLILRRVDLIHLRGYLLGIPVLVLKIFFKFDFIFDMRGFWPDEKADRAGWKRDSLKYRFFKKLEQLLLKSSHKIIVLTEEARNYLESQFNLPTDKISVIYTCTDHKTFTRNKLSNRKRSSRLAYVGTTIGAYDFKKCVEFFLESKKNNLFRIFDIFTADNHEHIIENLTKNGLSKGDYSIAFLERDALIKRLHDVEAVIFNLKDNFSIKASMPTKIGEVLGLQIPIICNNFNSDIYKISHFKNAIYLSDFNNCNTHLISNFLIRESLSQDCLETSKHFFSLSTASKNYKNVYEKYFEVT